MKLPACHDRQARKNIAMIYPLAGVLFGAVLGAWRAKSRGGKIPDMLQWAMAFAILFGILGLFVLIAIERSLT